MKIPKQAQKQANALFQVCKVKGIVDFQRALLAIELLVTKRPRGWRFIVEHLKNRVRLESAHRTVKVQSAIPLDETQRTEVSRVISGENPSLPLEFEYQTNPALLGGLRIQVGWNVLDASIRAKLERIIE